MARYRTAPDDARTLRAGLDIDYCYKESCSRSSIANIAINNSVITYQRRYTKGCDLHISMDVAANAIHLLNEYFSSEVGKQCFHFVR